MDHSDWQTKTSVWLVAATTAAKAGLGAATGGRSKRPIRPAPAHWRCRFACAPDPDSWRAAMLPVLRIRKTEHGVRRIIAEGAVQALGRISCFTKSRFHSFKGNDREGAPTAKVSFGAKVSPTLCGRPPRPVFCGKCCRPVHNETCLRCVAASVMSVPVAVACPVVFLRA